MKQTTAAVIILAIFGAVTAFTIYITHSGWWIIWWIIAFIIAFISLSENDTNDEV